MGRKSDVQAVMVHVLKKEASYVYCSVVGSLLAVDLIDQDTTQTATGPGMTTTFSIAQIFQVRAAGLLFFCLFEIYITQTGHCLLSSVHTHFLVIHRIFPGLHYYYFTSSSSSRVRTVTF